MVFLAAFTPLLLCSEVPAQAVHIGKILIVPGTPIVRLIVEADGPLASARGYYLPGSPSTFVLDLGGAQTSEAPAVPASEARFIPDIQVQKDGSRDLRILARLSERVPVRLRREARRTVAEFAKVQRHSLDADVQRQLAARPKGGIFLNGIDPSDAEGRVSFRIQLNRQAVAQVFSLENPWRLVVDIYDTVLRAKAPPWATEEAQVPVERIRAAQFQMTDPRPITRLVFDLKEPCVYSLDTDTNDLIVSFYKNRPVKSAGATPSAPVTAPASKPAPKQGPPTKAEAAAPAGKPEEPLVRKDLLGTGEKANVLPRRDIFRPRVSPSTALPPGPLGPATASSNRTPQAKEASAFNLNLVYVGSVRSGQKIVALVMTDGQTMPVAEGEEITPGYKVLRITDTEIEVEGPNSIRKTFTRQGDRP
jgi:hypothetical protein